MSIKPAHKSVEVIQEAVGRWSTDIAMGWEAGLMGKVRRGGRLFNRHPPDLSTNPKILDGFKIGSLDSAGPKRTKHYI